MLTGKTAIVTAAGAGIGKASARRLAADGARVIATDISADALQALQQIDGIETRQLDVTDDAAVNAFAAEVGKTNAVDILFNCAGFVHNGSVLECEDDEWNFAFNLNARAMYKMMRAFLPGMIAAGGGVIINMSSVASSLKAVPNRFVYSATKAAVIGMTKSVAADFVSQNIRCNAICPGTVDSPSLRERLRATGDFDAAMAQFIARQPMGRLATCDEIAALVTYLASDEAAFVNGQAYVIDGGWTA